MKLNESNKKVKIQNTHTHKKNKTTTRTYVDSNSGPFGCKLCTKTTLLVSSTMQNVSLSALVLAIFL